jgi:hypothetical protein
MEELARCSIKVPPLVAENTVGPSVFLKVCERDLLSPGAKFVPNCAVDRDKETGPKVAVGALTGAESNGLE